MSNFSQKESVYIIIPVHNRKQLTLECLEHLKKIGDLQRYYLIVVDDGSTDGTTEAINDLAPDVIVLPGDGDLWWTGAIALGMEYAYQQGAEYFIWLNDDSLPERGTLAKLIEFGREHPDTMVAPACYSIEGQRLEHNGFQGKKGVNAPSGKIVYVDGMCGWCLLIPRSVFGKIGPPDASKFPQYSGDDTYTLKATRSGFKACIIGDVKVNLVGPIQPNYKIQAYIKPEMSWAETLQALLGNKKSPYYLPTQFFYIVQKYGTPLGAILFLGKMSSLLLELVGLKLKSNINK